MAYLNSKKIRVFPSAFRGKDSENKQINPSSFLTLEENYVNIANKITNRLKDYFFVDGDNVHIVLHGYYFIVDNQNNLIQGVIASPSINDEVWVGASTGSLAMTSYEESTQILKPESEAAGSILDNAGEEFTALVFGSSADVDGCEYKMGLFKCTEINPLTWEIISKYTLNIKTDQIMDTSGESLDNKLTTDNIIVNNDISCASTVRTPNISGGSTLDIYGDVINMSARDNFNVIASSSATISANIINLYASSVSGITSGNISLLADKEVILAGKSVRFTGNAVPFVTNSYNLGTASFYWKSAYISSVHTSSINASNIRASNISVSNLSAGTISANLVSATILSGALTTNWIYPYDDNNSLVIGAYSRNQGIDLIDGYGGINLNTSASINLNGYGSINLNTSGDVVLSGSSIKFIGTGGSHPEFLTEFDIVPTTNHVTLGMSGSSFDSAYIDDLYGNNVVLSKINGHSGGNITISCSSGTINVSTDTYLNLRGGDTLIDAYGSIILSAGSIGIDVYGGYSGTGAISFHADTLTTWATTFVNNAYASNTKLTKDSVGNSGKPIYLDSGIPKECSNFDSGSYALDKATAQTAKIVTRAGSNTTNTSPSDINWDSDYAGGHINLAWIRMGKIIKLSIDFMLKPGKDLTGDDFKCFDLTKIKNIVMTGSYTGSDTHTINLDRCACTAVAKRSVLGNQGGYMATYLRSVQHTGDSAAMPYAFIGLDYAGGGEVDGFSAELTIVLN